MVGITRSPRSLLGILALALALVGLLSTGARDALAAPGGCVVTTTADGTAPVPVGSLREKLADSSCAAITFGVTGTITLGDDLPTIARTVSVTGPVGGLLIDRTPISLSSIAFSVASGGALTLKGLAVANSGNCVSITGSGSATVLNSAIGGCNRAIRLNGSGSVTVNSSTLEGDSDGLSLTNGGSATVTNSTILSRDRLLSVFSGSSATVTNSILYNPSDSGISVNGGSVILANTIVAAHLTNCGTGGGGTITNLSHNLATDDSCFADGANGSRIVTPDQIGLATGAPADNGGPTPTFALQPTSLARDAGDDAICAAAPVGGVDQRGAVRSAGAHCDIGPFEYGAQQPLALSTVRGDGRYRGSVTYTATLTQGGQPAANQVVIFTVRGAAQCSATGGPNACPRTDSSGVARLTIAMNLVAPGLYQNLVGAKFAGTAGYQASSATGPLVVTP